jgi:hypothetical protein
VRHPLEAIPLVRRGTVLRRFILATLVVAVAMGILDEQLKTPAVPFGIGSFELAGDVPTAQAMVDSWDVRARSAAGVSLGLDYLFMVLYATALALGCLWGATRFRTVAPALAALGAPLAWGQWLAGACDGVENFFLIRILLDGAQAPWPAVARWAATVKFALAGVGLLYVIGAALGGRRS